LPLALDHVVIAVCDLGAAMADYRALGFTVVEGGSHPGRTSHNALVVFGDGSYLELIAWKSHNAAERWCVEHARHGEGLMDFALLPGDTAAVIAAAKARGLALDGPSDGGRQRPDGAAVKWQTGRQATFDLPFLCGDVTPRSLRVPEGEARRHANGAAGIETVVVAVRDMEVSIARYRALVGDEGGVEKPRHLSTPALRVAVVRLGRTDIVLAAPEGAEEPKAEIGRRVRERLATRGEGPVAITLRLEKGSAPARFDEALAHRVPIDAVA
jgi:catechol 2,3-dioxygenase-like lactoylglutathione lyase family enzyme